MAKAKDIHDPESVNVFINKLEPEFGKLIQQIRKVILKVDPIIGEQIKWNAPSFFYTGEMKAFNAKEYKRDLVVLNVQKGKALLVFPTGASIADESGILEGIYTDGRRIVNITDEKDLKNKARDLQSVIRKWLSSVDKL